jgi:hypothetical protein
MYYFAVKESILNIKSAICILRFSPKKVDKDFLFFTQIGVNRSDEKRIDLNKGS